MKWNTIKVSAIYLVIAIGGFLLGKTANRNTELSEHDLLIEDSERLIHQRSDSRTRDHTTRPDRSKRPDRPNRPTRQGDDKNLDQKLANLKEIVSNPNALDRGRGIMKWIDTLAPDEFEAAVDALRLLGNSNKKLTDCTMMALAAWAKVDPASALAYTTQNQSREADATLRSMDWTESIFTSGEATSNVLSTWTNDDPDAAIEWAKSHHQGDEANPYMLGIIRGLAESDMGRATTLLQDLPFGTVRGDSLLSMMPHLMKMDPESAEKWIAEIKDDRLRKGAIARYSEAMANQDPALAASYLINHVSDRSMDSVSYVFNEWSKVDSAAAIANFESIPDDEVRGRAMSGVFRGLQSNNPQAAAELMSRFDDSAKERK